MANDNKLTLQKNHTNSSGLLLGTLLLFFYFITKIFNVRQSQTKKTDIVVVVVVYEVHNVVVRE